MKSAKSKRQFTLLTLVVALGVAVYLNWEYAKTDAPFALQDPGAVSANAAVETVTDGTTSGVLSETEKTAVTQTLTNTINSITVESDIENMVKAKGFADCVAFIEGEKINLAVKTGSEGLDKSEVAQLRDIILGKMETEAKNISIVEVK